MHTYKIDRRKEKRSYFLIEDRNKLQLRRESKICHCQVFWCTNICHMLWDYRHMSWNLLLGFLCYLHKDGCLLLHLLFHFLAKWIKQVTFTAVFEHNSRIITVQKKTKKRSWHSLQDQGSAAISFAKPLHLYIYIYIYILAQHSNRICGNFTLHERNHVERKCYWY